MRRNSIEQDPETGTPRGYPHSQYYPGVSDPALAVVVPLAGGGSLAGFDIHLRRGPLVNMSGHVVDGLTNEPFFSATVELVPESGRLTDETFMRRQTKLKTGGFQFESITPGTYALLISYQSSSRSSLYVRQVDVGAGGIEDLRVSVPQLGSISGRVITPERSKDPRKFTIFATAKYQSRREVSVSADGSFRVDEIPPGIWSIGIASTNGILYNGEVYVASIRQNGSSVDQNGLVGTVTIGEGAGAQVEIELSDQVGWVTGKVSDDDQRPVEGALVALASSGRPPYQIVTNQSGGFSVKLPPESYSVSAWPRRTDIGQLPAEKSHACGDRVANVQVTAGVSTFAQLRMCKP